MTEAVFIDVSQELPVLRLTFEAKEVEALRSVPEHSDTASLFRYLRSSQAISNEEFTKSIRKSRNRRQKLKTTAVDEPEDSVVKLHSERLFAANRLLNRLEKSTKDSAENDRIVNCGMSLAMEVYGSDNRLLHRVLGNGALSLADKYNSIWPRLRDDWLRVGIPEELLQEYENDHERDLNLFAKVQRLYASGETMSDIGKALSLKHSLVTQWTRGSNVPWSMRWVFNEAARLKRYPIPKHESEPFAYVLGAYLATMRTNRRELDVSSRDLDSLEYLRDQLNTVFGYAPAIRKDNASSKEVLVYRLTFSSTSVLSYFHRVTQGSREIPYEHLGTMEEQKAFLRGYLDFGSGISHKRLLRGSKEAYYPYVGLTFTDRRLLLTGLRDIFFRVGIFPLHTEERNGVERLEISGISDLNGVETLGFRAQRKSQKLTLERERADRKQKEYGPDEYNTVFRLSESGMSLRAIARETEIARKTLSRWLNGDSKPERVARMEKAQQAIQGLPDCQAMALLCREYSVSREIARKISHVRSFSEIQTNIQVILDGGYQVGDCLTLLSAEPSLIKEKMKELASPTQMVQQVNASRLTDEVHAFFKLREQHEVPKPERQRELLRLAQEGDLAARNELIESNQGLIISLCKKYRRSDVEMADLLSSGNVGLCIAIDYFDLGKTNTSTGEPLRFSTYAFYWIRNEIIQTLRLASNVPVPDHVFFEIKELKTAEAQLKEELDAVPTDTQLSKRLAWKVSKVKAIKAASRVRYQSSLNAPVGSDEGGQLIDLIPQATDEDGSNALDQKELIPQLIADAFNALGLDDKEQRLVQLRFGMGDDVDQEHTLRQIADEFGVTYQAIGQREAKIFKKFRENMNVREVRALFEYMS